MTEHHPHSVVRTWGNDHDYLPAAGRDFLLPGYDLITRLLGFGPIYDELIASADLDHAGRILEIGCGTGNLAMRAHRVAPEAWLTATDPDPGALARARRKIGQADRVQLHVAYAQRLPFADRTFDRVLSSMMLHHLDNDVKAAALAEVFRVLRSGGRLHIVDVGGDIHRPGLLSRITGHDHSHAAARLPELIRAAGFDCEVTGTRHVRLTGAVTFFRATKAAE
ncbi:class I SAM-dependent methyltransferase [Mycolicibacterium sp. BiH015]|uniref:class I SAM-dependent methyltransferase n=1 Tax=Mycolicibacterium sp. BiH015 TaxID=3018808 RepID=UPI0022E59CDF|nr:class I SAM-dependent methyltransferase [Mycolicibacterium sp. BiH015]MDA2889925.1 class I SAM-dependent methyltransferase [Mycolicibacterium sp. BiH015]